MRYYIQDFVGTKMRVRINWEKDGKAGVSILGESNVHSVVASSEIIRAGVERVRRKVKGELRRGNLFG